MKEPRVCPECGKKFRPMTDRLWTVNYFQHRLMHLRHESMRTPEYVERIEAEFRAERLKQGLQP